jgi:hypothetical protein
MQVTVKQRAWGRVSQPVLQGEVRRYIGGTVSLVIQTFYPVWKRMPKEIQPECKIEFIQPDFSDENTSFLYGPVYDSALACIWYCLRFRGYLCRSARAGSPPGQAGSRTRQRGRRHDGFRQLSGLQRQS